MTSVESLVDIIQLNIDSDEVIIGQEVFKSCSLRTRTELTQWLYAVLHVRNTELLSQENGKSLEENIKESIQEKRIPISGEIKNYLGMRYISVGGIRVAVDQGNHLEISKLRPNLTPGFFYYMNSMQEDQFEHLDTRYYIYATNPDTALKTWSSIIENLEKQSICFSTKILSNVQSYPRTDAIVIYSNKRDQHMILDVITEQSARTVKEEEKLHTSLLCKVVNPIISYAEQPIFKGQQTSFGEDRCEAIATAIKDSFSTGLDFSMLLTRRLELAGINPDRIYENK